MNEDEVDAEMLRDRYLDYDNNGVNYTKYTKKATSMARESFEHMLQGNKIEAKIDPMLEEKRKAQKLEMDRRQFLRSCGISNIKEINRRLLDHAVRSLYESSYYSSKRIAAEKAKVLFAGLVDFNDAIKSANPKYKVGDVIASDDEYCYKIDGISSKPVNDCFGIASYSYYYQYTTSRGRNKHKLNIQTKQSCSFADLESSKMKKVDRATEAKFFSRHPFTTQFY